jgi:hypothetical protein
MDLRRKIILQDLQTMVEACKAIFGRVSHDGRRSIPIALRIKIADEVVTAARNGNYSRDDIIAAVAHEMTKLLPAPDPSPRSRQPR